MILSGSATRICPAMLRVSLSSFLNIHFLAFHMPAQDSRTRDKVLNEGGPSLLLYCPLHKSGGWTVEGAGIMHQHQNLKHN